MRRIGLGILLWLVAAGWASAEIRFLDDRGEPIASPLEACFQMDLRTECVNSGSGDTVEPPGRFLLLRVEGPDHGPISLRYEELEEGLLARVPRKALLQIEKLPADPLTVSVYDKRAPSFDKPLFSAKGVRPEGIKIPAGDFLVSFSSGRQAPDLHLLSAPPGSITRVEYRPRRGWSLVLRCRGAKDRQPLAASSVSLESVLGYDAPNRLIEEQKTGEDGLAIFSGLLGRTVDAGVRHSEYLSQKVQGLSAAPGSLAFREVVLEEGGRLHMKVLMEGRVQEGVGCRIVDPQAARDSQPLYEGTTNREGICRSQKLAAGSYLLFASLPEERGRLSRTLVIRNSSDTEEEFAFSKVRLGGKVSRGNDPVPGFMVRVYEINEELNAPVGVGKGQSGEDGTYEIALWKPGRYGVALLESPKAQVSLVQKNIVIEDGEEAETVDFPLESASVRGKVIDEGGNPLAEADVSLRWGGGGERWGRTDDRGEFEFLLEGQGSGDVKAEKEGYRPSQFQEVALADETELPPVTLILEKEKLFKGTLSSASGLPVAGGWVGAMKSYYGDEHIEQPREGRTDAEGRFEVAPLSGVRNRLFASGPGCPLSFFEPLDTGGDLALRCQGQPAVLDLTLTDSEGRPIPNAAVVLRRGNVILPRTLLDRHLDFLGLRAQTDASGRIVIPNLAPGEYDVFLASQSQIEGMIEAGSRTGYLQTVRLTPLNTTRLQLTAGTRPPSGL